MIYNYQYKVTSLKFLVYICNLWQNCFGNLQKLANLDCRERKVWFAKSSCLRASYKFMYQKD